MSTLDQHNHLVIIGKGNQARAWAHNLSLNESSFFLAIRDLKTGKDLNFPHFELGEKLKDFKNFALLIPDSAHEDFLLQYQEYLQPGSRIIYAHGYSVSYNHLVKKFPQFEHILFAPKSIANQIIENAKKNIKTAVVISLEHSRPQTRKYLETLAKSLHFFIAGEVSFQDEVTADLFSEQSLLCGLYPYIIHMAYKLLKEQGIHKNLSFLECWHESKLIMDTLIENGPENFFKMISPNALIGSQYAYDRLFDKDFETKLKSLLDDITTGQFKKYYDNQNLEEVSKDVTNYWKHSELQANYEELKGQLYK